MSSTALPLGLSQAFSATEGPRAAQLAVFHTGSPRGISESALGREKDSDEFKILEARVRALPGKGSARKGSTLTLDPQAGEEERACSKAEPPRHWQAWLGFPCC